MLIAMLRPILFFSLGPLLVLSSETLTVSHLTWLLVAHISSDRRQVTVGVEGSFFEPPTINALQGDVVQFIFGGA